MKDVILEGVDGAGKTYLLNQLMERYGLEQTPRQATSLGGPIANMCDLIDALRITPHERPWIYDRHSLFSEPAYGWILRGYVAARFNDEQWVADLEQWCDDKTVVIHCVPPLEVVEANLAADPLNQLSGVVANIKELYNFYNAMMSAYPNVIRYDYTSNTFDELCDKLVDAGVFTGGSLA